MCFGLLFLKHLYSQDKVDTSCFEKYLTQQHYINFPEALQKPIRNLEKSSGTLRDLRGASRNLLRCDILRTRPENPKGRPESPRTSQNVCKKQVKRSNCGFLAASWDSRTPHGNRRTRPEISGRLLRIPRRVLRFSGRPETSRNTSDTDQTLPETFRRAPGTFPAPPETSCVLRFPGRDLGTQEGVLGFQEPDKSMQEQAKRNICGLLAASWDSRTPHGNPRTRLEK